MKYEVKIIENVNTSSFTVSLSDFLSSIDSLYPLVRVDVNCYSHQGRHTACVVYTHRG